MMNSEEYKAWLASRKGENKKVKVVKIPKAKPVAAPEVPFLDWLLAQPERQDDTERLARDVASERKRIGRPLDHLNDRFNLIWYCDRAPKEIGLNREIARAAWAEWVAGERAKEGEAARNGK
jgi:hypothetical protein